LWDRVDVILTPTTPIQAPLIGQTVVGDEDVRLASTRFVRPFNVLGIPALSIPFRTGSLPTGIQIVGQPFQEQAVVEVAQLLEHDKSVRTLALLIALHS
jgi:aspartyl-tRNA(Asn)/glutamyl-tRNA(Gln) amidotransferase subunit A